MSRSEQEARLGCLLTEPGPGLVAVCERAWSALDDLGDSGGWLPVQVPCLSALSPGWLLQALVAGAPAVTLVGCGGYCRAEAAEEISGMVEYCREVLAAVGENPGRIRLGGSHDRPNVEHLPVPRPGALDGPIVLSEPGAAADAVVRLAGSSGSEVRIEHPASPLGMVAAAPGACTVCGACGEVCPTGALAIDRDGEREVLRFDHRGCVGCGACIGICPEAALSLRKETDLAALVNDPVVLAETATVHCESCGRPVAPAAMLNRLARVLADSPEVLDIVGRRCADCRTGARVGPPIG
jgi:ferredoxin